ncbi:methyltransferase family protein [Lentzea atacamensis]|uniref:Methyltransferase family protein n=1 Tax=Lentzea atacamensis TaxID=531938 RepID=A0A316IDK6_9PSEU|nr:class I SAM-dependent methyltransferase [Lentzea atacamensis]PWK90760.1 methyltransferase family protein [Lentzea atacamensis]
MTTPVRNLQLVERDGFLLLGDRQEVSYLDGGEELVGAIVAEAGDRGSMSDELHIAAKAWVEQYHLDRGRANVLRALDLPADAAVLEIGSGCGAITRYLGETVALVDSVEPVAARARVGARRTADLPNVRVFVGMLEDVPAEPAYDLVFVIGVLEYVPDRPAFLESLRRRLKPGGTLVLAIENQLGVKYLAGGHEDHTGVRWEGVQGYPNEGPARTFARRPLENLLSGAGFRPVRTFGCFPDYKITRAVMTAELAEQHPGLATELPHFPSPDWGFDEPRPVDEAALWHQFVGAGLAAEAWNSFLVIATAEAGESALWPDDRLAVYFNTDRAARWCSQSEVLVSQVIRRTPLVAQIDDEVSVRAYDEPLVEGTPLLTLLAKEPWRVEELLTTWREVLRERADELGGAIWDLLPHNLLVTADGVVAIDLEWCVEGMSVADVEQRGLLLAADKLAAAGWRGAGERTTVRDLAGWLGVLLGHAPSYVDDTVEREARFQAVRICGITKGAGLRREQDYLRTAWQNRLAELVGGAG